MLHAFVCIKCCTDVPEEEAKAHPSNTAEGRGRGVKTLMNGCEFLYSLLQCGDRAAIIGAAHNESLQEENTQKHACAHAHTTYTLRKCCFKIPFGKKSRWPLLVTRGSDQELDTFSWTGFSYFVPWL